MYSFLLIEMIHDFNHANFCILFPFRLKRFKVKIDGTVRNHLGFEKILYKNVLFTFSTYYTFFLLLNLYSQGKVGSSLKVKNAFPFSQNNFFVMQMQQTVEPGKLICVYSIVTLLNSI